MTARRPRTLLAAAAIAAGLVFAYARLLFGGEVLYYKDLLHYVYPMQRLVAASYAAGELPLWNPHSFCGAPLAAQGDVSAFYPPALLFLLGDPASVYPFYLLAHHALAAAGTFALLRALRCSREAAAVGACAFALSGALVSSHDAPRLLAGAAWMPWALAWARRARDGGGARAAAVAGLALGMELLAGGIEPAIVTVLAMGLFGLPARRRMALGRESLSGAAVLRIGRALLPLALAVAIGAGLAAIELVPLATWALGSSRAGGPAAADRAAWSLRPIRLAEAAVPDVFGVVLPETTFRRRVLSGEETVPWHATIYAGGVTLGLALLGLRSRRGAGARAAIAALGLASLALALGPDAPVVGLIHRLPGLSLFRFAEKLYVGAALAVPLLAGLGADALAVARRSLRIRAALLAAILALLIEALTFGGARLAGDLVAPEAPLASAMTALALLAAAGLSLAPVRGPTLALALVAILATDLGHNARRHLFSTPAGGVPQRPWAVERMSALAAGETPPPRFARDPEFTPFALPPGVEDRGAASFVYQLESLISNAALPLADSVGGFAPGRSPRYERFMAAMRGRAELAFAMLDVGFVVARSSDPLALRMGRAVTVSAALDITLTRPKLRLPRAFLASRARAFSSDDGVERAIADPSFEPWREALLTAPEAPSAGALIIDGPPGGSARVTRYRAGEVTVAVEAPAPVALILADAYDPAWRATVDGASARVFPANILLRAVLVPEGRHEVRFAYRPLPVAIGGAASVAMLLATALLFLKRSTNAKAPTDGD